MQEMVIAVSSAAAAAVAFLLGRRRFGGSIRSSEAVVLWKAAEKLRHDLTEEARQWRDRAAHLEEHVERCNKENVELRERIQALERQINGKGVTT